jgi:hypothetical protein
LRIGFWILHVSYNTDDFLSPLSPAVGRSEPKNFESKNQHATHRYIQFLWPSTIEELNASEKSIQCNTIGGRKKRIFARHELNKFQLFLCIGEREKINGGLVSYIKSSSLSMMSYIWPVTRWCVSDHTKSRYLAIASRICLTGSQ